MSINMIREEKRGNANVTISFFIFLFQYALSFSLLWISHWNFIW